MNFLEAEVADGQVRGDGFAFALPTWAGNLERGTAVTLGIRPEDVTLRHETGPAAASISLVEPMGSSTIVYTRVGPNLVAIETGKDTILGVGSTVSLAIEPNRLHLFDAVSGRSLAPAQ
jgi:multiple sugar transport system ATP-binding protein